MSQMPMPEQELEDLKRVSSFLEGRMESLERANQQAWESFNTVCKQRDELHLQSNLHYNAFLNVYRENIELRRELEARRNGEPWPPEDEE